MNNEVVMTSNAGNLPFLMEMHRWGIEVIKAIQKIENPALTMMLKFITALGTEVLYVPFILFIFWWIDEKRGLRLGILIIASAWINTFLKDILKQPRPFNLDPSVGLAHESSYGAPSGHAQMSLTFWVPMAAWCSQAWTAMTGEKAERRRKRIIWGAAVFFILLIAFTRLYLGVHFPTDIFAGWILGGIILCVFFIAGPYLEKLFAAAGIRSQNICVAAIVLLMNGVYPHDRAFPALLLGFCLGYTLMKQRFPFSARGEIDGKKPGIKVMFFRCITGFLGLAVIYLGLRLILPGEGSLFADIPVWGKFSPYYPLGRFIRYAFLGFWASAGAPWIFQLMGLAADVKAGSNADNNSGQE